MRYDREMRTLPGFHIFMNSQIFEHNVARIHNDLQYSGSAKFGATIAEGGTLRETDMFSFTLPISLPSSAGLNVYENKVCSESEHMVTKCKDYAFGETSFRQVFHSYHVGELVVHRGLVVHQVSKSEYWGPGEVRITLQGHGVCEQEECHLYW